MYKLLLSWRYLRTRYIALASIVSVTLGVATLIVVNSVMSGFSAEMHDRLHDILSDVVIESPGLDGIYDPDWHMREVREVVGDDLQAMTAIVRVPAMLHFSFQGRTVTQQLMLIGIDPATYAKVSNCGEFLLHAENRKQISFDLRENGYDSRLPPCGWEHRRVRAELEREMIEQAQLMRQSAADALESSTPTQSEDDPHVIDGVYFPPLPRQLPAINDTVESQPPGLLSDAPPADASKGVGFHADPFELANTGSNGAEVEPFNEWEEQYTGVILGIAISNVKRRDEKTGEVIDWFLCRPGDDVQVTFPTSGVPPRPISSKFTIVDFFESKMSDYDSTFAFVPLEKLQELRGMIDPESNVSSVTSIQLKLRDGVDANAVRDKIREHFAGYPYHIKTWRDLQGPILAAVRLETVILNILLFLIIAVAGFGILATFFMIVVEKTRDIGIMKALGAPNGGVMSIFLTYGLSLGIVGAGVGTVLGLLFVTYINDIASLMEYVTGEPVFDPTVYYFQQIPTIIDPWTVAWVAGGSVLIAVLASVLPAIRAARMHTVEALRYE